MLREVMLAWTGSGIALVDADIHIGVESSNRYSRDTIRKPNRPHDRFS